MADVILKKKSKEIFILTSFIIFAAIFTIEKINGRFWLNDFKVFYMAAKAMLNNEQVYGIAFGLDTGFYKYSPFTLFFFIPFTFLQFETAAVIDFIIISVTGIATIILLVRIIGKYLFIQNEISYLSLFAIQLCIINHLVRELHLGNTNMMLVFLLCMVLKLSLESKPLSSGMLMAIVILTKPYFIICLLPFLLVKKFKTIVSTLIFVIFFVSAQFLFTGISKSVTLYREWFSAMLEHSNYLYSNHTIFSLAGYYMGIHVPASYGIFFLGAAAILLFIFFWYIDRKNNDANNSGSKKNGSLIIYYFLLISIIPNLLITDTEHFLFSLPLITILLLQLGKAKNKKWIIPFILLIFLYGGNSSDLLGKHLAGKFEELGLLGLSNLIISGTVIFTFVKYGKTWKDNLTRIS